MSSVQYETNGQTPVMKQPDKITWTSIRNMVRLAKSEKFSGSISFKINFFGGGITGINIEKRETFKSLEL